MKIFVDTDADIRLARRLERDISERGREIDGVIQQYTRFVKPSYDHYIAPTMIYADLIVPRGEKCKLFSHIKWFVINNQIILAVSLSRVKICSENIFLNCYLLHDAILLFQVVKTKSPSI